MTILIVDDNEQSLYVLQALLGGNAHQVMTAAHGAEALAKARQNPPDLVISDILMPVMDGFSLCREWKKDARLRPIPFVFYTATYTDERDREFALSLGAERFIVKPEEPEAFIEIIREVLTKHAQNGLVASRPPVEEEVVYLKQYNETLIRKLEAKMEQLEEANRALARDNTERQRVEAALRESTARHRTILRTAIDGFWRLDRQGRVLEVNETYCRMSGYSEQELLALSVPDLEAVETPADTAARVQEVMARGELRFETRHRRKDGSTFPLEVSAQYKPAEGGYFVAFLRDITERKLAEEALRASEKKFQGLFESSRDAIMTLEPPAWKFTSGNPAAVKMFGAKHEEEFISHRPWDLSPERQPDGRASGEKAREMIKMALREGSQAFEWTYRRLGGEEFPADVLLNRLEREGKTMLQATVRDITARRRAEESQARLAMAVEQAAEAIMITDAAGAILYVNPAFEKITGYTRPEVAGQNPRILKSGKHDAAFYRQMWAVLTAGQVWTGHFVNRRKDGALYEEDATISPMLDAAGKIVSYVAVKHDVTDRRKLEAQFLQAQRTESIGALASGVAHDLNNILQPILMTAPLLRDTAQDADSRAMLDTVEACALRGADIIKQLLIFARGTPGARVPLPVGHLLRDMHKIIGETFPRDIRTLVDSPKDLWPVPGDATQLHQVLMNLCVNARDAMPDGGALTLRAKNVTVDETFASMTLGARPGAYVCVSVTDTGIGIPPENLERIFDPFFTTKEIGKGTGLGLATVLGIVRGHQGFVRVDSRLGQGTTFELYFPASPEARAAHAPAREGPPRRGQGELILVVDDEATVRESARRILELGGYRVVTASQGAEGLAAFAQHATEIRAVLTDMMMPVMSGPAMIAALRRIEPRLVALGMTGLPERSGVKGLESLDLPAVLTKPFTGDELLRALHAALPPSAEAAPRKGTEPD